MGRSQNKCSSKNHFEIRLKLFFTPEKQKERRKLQPKTRKKGKKFHIEYIVSSSTETLNGKKSNL